MREGSSDAIRPGMRVLGRGDQPLGTVERVLVDRESGIFVGLAVSPGLFSHALFLPAEQVERLHERTVYSQAAPDELEPYVSPEERHQATEKAFRRARD